VNTLFTGVAVALATLFDESGEVDYAATAKHAQRLVEAGVQAVVVAGTTGEADSLTPDERSRLLDSIREALASQPEIQVIAGTGAPSARQAAFLTKQARDAGADAVLVLPPRNTTNLKPYYQSVADAAGGIPVIAYHYPAVSPPGVAVGALPELPVAACKDSSGEPERLLAMRRDWSGLAYVGFAPILFLAGQLGCAGAILALANIEPELCRNAFEGSVTAQVALLAGHQRCRASFPHGLKGFMNERFGTSTVTRLSA
jgi:4-hydroxy-tetrahydrodipicolinate synthase